MRDTLDSLLASSEFYLLAALIVISALYSQGWFPEAMYASVAIPLAVYVVGRFTSKTAKNTVNGMRAKRGTNQAYGGREVEK